MPMPKMETVAFTLRHPEMTDEQILKELGGNLPYSFSGDGTLHYGFAPVGRRDGATLHIVKLREHVQERVLKFADPVASYPAGDLRECPQCHMLQLDLDLRRKVALCLGTTCGFRQPVRDREEFEEQYGKPQPAVSNREG